MRSWQSRSRLYKTRWNGRNRPNYGSRITADPTRYQNRTVKVSGTVVNSIGLLGTGGYQIEDETGKIYVISSTGVPSKGSRVTVTGTVMSGAQVLGRSIGTAIRERGHKVK